MSALRLANLGVRFGLELAALAAVAYWGATAPAGRPARVALAIAAPVLVAIAWGMFISPKARIPTGLLGRGILGFVVFTLAALALWSRGQASLAAAYEAIALASSVLLVVWRQ
ncbi:MAG TPA: YrdB family protein [Gemmatimonadaceae bacterium]